MTIASHFVVGAAIATQVKTPALVAILAFLSHFLVDVIPHHCLRKLEPWSYLQGKTKKIWSFRWPLKMQLFSLFQISLILLLVFGIKTRRDFSLLVFGGTMAIIPDIYEWSRYVFDIRHRLPTLHFLHNSNSKSRDSVWGILTQVVIFLIALSFLF